MALARCEFPFCQKCPSLYICELYRSEYHSFYSLLGVLGFLGLLWFCILHCEARINLRKTRFQKVCFLCTGCSFQHSGLWWSGIGKCKHMCLKIFGPSIVITVLRKAMLTSLGRMVFFHFWFIFYFVVSKDQTDMQEMRVLLSRSQKDNKPSRISFSNVHVKPRELME